jgi:multidrug efflux pump subunit AcrB
MGKYIGYAIVILVILLILEWFKIVDIPFLEIPDFTAGKKNMLYKTKEALD